MMRVFHILPSHSLCVLLGEEKDRWRHDIHINVFDLAEMAVYSWHTHTSLHDLSIEDDKGLQCPDLSLNFESCSVYTLEQMKLLSLTLNQLTVSPPSSSSWSHTHLLALKREEHPPSCCCCPNFFMFDKLHCWNPSLFISYHISNLKA